jgi:hypothetical protein
MSIWNNKGVSLIDVAISSAILGAAALSVSYFVVNTKTSMKSTGDMSSCESSAQTFLNRFSDIGTGDSRFKAYAIRNDTTGASVYTGADGLSAVNALAGGLVNNDAGWFTTNIVSSAPVTITNGHLIASTATTLEAMLKLNNAYSTGVVHAGLSAELANGSNLRSPQVVVQIVPYNLSTGDYALVANHQIRPKSMGTNLWPNMGGSDSHGYELTVSIRHTISDGTVRVCQASQRYFLEPDSNYSSGLSQGNVEIRASSGKTVSTGPWADPTDANITSFCPNSGDSRNITATITISNLEPGSVLLCQGYARRDSDNAWAWNVNNPNAWDHCGNFSTSDGVPVDSASWDEGSGQLSLSFLNMNTDREYIILVRAVDPGGNLSPIIEIPGWRGTELGAGFEYAGRQDPNPANMPRGFVLDVSPPVPVGGSLACTNSVVGRADLNGLAGSNFNLGDANELAVAQTYGAKLFQCDQAQNSNWRVEMGNTLHNEICGAYLDHEDTSNSFTMPITGVPFSAVERNNTRVYCEFTIGPPNPPGSFVDGDVLMTAQVGDDCHPINTQTKTQSSPAQTDTRVWTVDVGPMLASQHDYFNRSVVPLDTLFPNPFETGENRWDLTGTRQSALTMNDSLVWEIPRTDGTRSRTLSDPPPYTTTLADIGWNVGSDHEYHYTQGFCAVGWTGCGNSMSTTSAVPLPASHPLPSTAFAVRGQLGDSCYETPCEDHLMCPKRGPNTGICSNPSCSGWQCWNHEDCLLPNSCTTNTTPGGEPFPYYCSVAVGQGRYCVTNTDCITAQGAGICVSGECECPDESPIGRPKTVSSDTDAPDLSFLCNPGGAGANCNCDLATANATCMGQTFADSCGNPDMCNGFSLAAGCVSAEICLVEAICNTNTTTSGPLGNGWLGFGSGLEGVGNCGVPNGAPPFYTIECNTVSGDPADGNWRPCAADDANNWPPESPTLASGNPQELDYWVKATDARGDHAVCNGKYKLDRTPPQFTDNPYIPNTCCGFEQETPTLGTTVEIVDIGLENTVVISPEWVECNGSTGAPVVDANCANTPVDPSPDASGTIVTVIGKDSAGNEFSYNDPSGVPAYVARRTGLTHDYIGADSANCKNSGVGCVRGCSAVSGDYICDETDFGFSIDPDGTHANWETTHYRDYTRGFQNVIYNGNELNFESSACIDNNYGTPPAKGLTVFVCAEPVTKCAAAGTGAGPWIQNWNLNGQPYGSSTVYGRAFPASCWQTSGMGRFDWGYGTAYWRTNFGLPGNRTSIYKIYDKCGNSTNEFSRTAYMDWFSPKIGKFEFTNSETGVSMTVTASDAVTATAFERTKYTPWNIGVGKIRAACWSEDGSYDTGLEGSNGSSHTITGIPWNKWIVCGAYAIDQLGNSGYMPDGGGKRNVGFSERQRFCQRCAPAETAKYCSGQTFTDPCTGETCNGTHVLDPATECDAKENVCQGVVKTTPEGCECPAGEKDCTSSGSPTYVKDSSRGAEYAEDPTTLYLCQCTIAEYADGTSYVVCGTQEPTCEGIDCDTWRGNNCHGQETTDQCGTVHTGNRCCTLGQQCLGHVSCYYYQSTNPGGGCEVRDCEVVCGECGVPYSGCVGCFSESAMIDIPMIGSLEDSAQYDSIYDIPRTMKSIRDIDQGDLVFAYNETNNELVISEVTDKFIHKDIGYGEVIFTDGSSMQVTPEHLVYLPLLGQWEAIGKLQPGDILLKKTSEKSDYVSIQSVDWNNKTNGTVYNLSVFKYRNYFVNGILVHNRKDCGPSGPCEPSTDFP